MFMPKMLQMSCSSIQGHNKYIMCISVMGPSDSDQMDELGYTMALANGLWSIINTL